MTIRLRSPMLTLTALAASSSRGFWSEVDEAAQRYRQEAAKRENNRAKSMKLKRSKGRQGR